MENPTSSSPNVANRLRQQIKSAKALGFQVRFEAFDDQAPSWCVLGKNKYIFLDVQATTRDQLSQLDTILEDYGRRDAA